PVSSSLARPPLYPLSLHDALPICPPIPNVLWKRSFYDHFWGSLLGCRLTNSSHLGDKTGSAPGTDLTAPTRAREDHSAAVRSWIDRKSTRLNSSHDQISYAVFCLK